MRNGAEMGVLVHGQALTGVVTMGGMDRFEGPEMLDEAHRRAASAVARRNSLAAALVRDGHSVEWMAEKCGVSEATVRAWARAGRRAVDA